MRRSITRFWLLLSIPFVPVHAVCQAKGPTDPLASRSGLSVHWKDRYLSVKDASIPGDSIEIHYLEAYCRAGSTDRDWSETVIRHTSRLVDQSEDHQRLKIEDRLDDGVIVNHLIQAGDDEVTFTVTATNPTDEESQAHWAQPCMRVDKFTGTDPKKSRDLYPPYIKKYVF